MPFFFKSEREELYRAQMLNTSSKEDRSHQSPRVFSSDASLQAENEYVSIVERALQ
jgi:hypothetical protein